MAVAVDRDRRRRPAHIRHRAAIDERISRLHLHAMAAAYNEWMAEKYPSMNAEIKKRIQEGRWEIVGGMWVEPDLNMPSGESLVRQLLVGKRWYKQAYEVDVRI